MSARYADIRRFVWMLISSEITGIYLWRSYLNHATSSSTWYWFQTESLSCRKQRWFLRLGVRFRLSRYQAESQRWFLRLGDRFRSVWKICEKDETGGVVGLGDTPHKVRRWYSWTFPLAACEWKSTVCKKPSGSGWKPRGIIQYDYQIIRSMALHPCLQAVEDPSAWEW